MYIFTIHILAHHIHSATREALANKSHTAMRAMPPEKKHTEKSPDGVAKLAR